MEDVCFSDSHISIIGTLLICKPFKYCQIVFVRMFLPFCDFLSSVTESEYLYQSGSRKEYSSFLNQHWFVCDLHYIWLVIRHILGVYYFKWHLLILCVCLVPCCQSFYIRCYGTYYTPMVFLVEKSWNKTFHLTCGHSLGCFARESRQLRSFLQILILSNQILVFSFYCTVDSSYRIHCHI